MIPTMTLARFIVAEQRKHSQSTGELSDLLQAVSLATKIIGGYLRADGLYGPTSYTDFVNVQGEVQHQLDRLADETLVDILGSSGHFALLLSEERNTAIETDRFSRDAKYVLAFDPLDGSSNLGTGVPVGTIFGIFKRCTGEEEPCPEDFLQSGRKLVAAGYALYSATTTFVYSSGRGVHGFTLDPRSGEFVLTHEQIRTPERGGVYSINEGNSLHWSEPVRQFVSQLKADNKEKKTPYALRYAGSLVADFDRNLRKGGVFLYPGDKKHPRGKLRLLYECMPLAFIAEQAGGRATDGEREILDLVPSEIHERCPLVIGSRHEVDWFMSMRGK